MFTRNATTIAIRPTISLLIAMRNEERYIAGCLKSVFAQTYPAELIEVFVLDGMSSDLSWTIADQLIQKKDNCHLLPNPKTTQSAAWNLGIERAKGDLITIVSAHSILASDYISNAVETHLRTGADMVGGPMTAIGEGRVARAISIATSSSFGIGGARFHYTDKEEIVDAVYMGFCSRSLYMTIGGFDEEMIRNQDDELGYRILDRGGTIICNPAIRSQYYNRATLRSLWRQYFQYGFYKVRVLQKHPRQIRMRQFAPPVFVLALLFSALLAFSPGLRLFSIIVPSLYLVASLFASLWASSKRDWGSLTLLPVAFAILHLSYGLGFLTGLFRFRHRWGDTNGVVPMWSTTQRHLSEPLGQMGS
jgi:succinoglycan biosynthesis protein ExoA